VTKGGPLSSQLGEEHNDVPEETVSHPRITFVEKSDPSLRQH